MARAYASTQPLDYSPEPLTGEWQALRGELVALLDQVEGQMARTRTPGQDVHGLAERMRELRYQVGETDPDLRHREALRSVKRAVDRFSERDEIYADAGFAARRDTYAPNPRDTLQSAIQQIRARHVEPMPTPRAHSEQGQLNALAQAVTGISGRLERLETELRTAARSQTGNVKEIADQVAQLSHVIELLAGAVGETGQVKRLESQIQGLARLITEEPKSDAAAMARRLDEVSASIGRLMEVQQGADVTRRLDDVSATMGRLADLQVQFANKADNNGLKDGMHAIEEGVRNIYDRIDAIEKQTALSPADIERLIEEMARFTQALNGATGPEGLVAALERLNLQADAIQGSGSEVGGLKADLDALRAIVAEAMEPRFAALEMQIEALSDRVTDHPDIGVGQLEAQVRQLVARMDQTGEQLTGLARLYSQPTEAEPPDFDALADMVAARTSEAVAQALPPIGGGAGLPEAGIDEIERRVSRLLDATAREDITGIEASIREVGDRIARLERSLSARAHDADAGAPEAEPVAAFVADSPEPAIEDAREPVRAPRDDAMPANPVVDAPLRDKPFGDDPNPVRAALEAGNTSSRPLHPGLSYEPLADQGTTAAGAAPSVAAETSGFRPHFNPATIERPPQPVSSLEAEAPLAFSEPTGPSDPAPELVPEPAATAEATPSANTFIAAARRAAQRQQANKDGSAPGSLIAKAFASLQPQGAAEPDRKRKPKKERAPRGRRLLAGDKKARTSWTPGEEASPEAQNADPVVPEPIARDQEVTTPPDDKPAKESFLLRYRRPILLGASLVAIALLTLNLINQRMAQDEAATTPPASTGDTSALDTDASSALSARPAATMTSAVSAPRVIPIVDSLATASVDPAAATGFTPSSEIPAMPAAFAPMVPRAETTQEAALAPLAAAVTPLLGTIETVPEIDSPVAFEMPPAGLGPEPLRRAAAAGDARAQFEVAAIYTEGRAVPEDLAAAAIWYERAAAQGFAPAQYRLGNLFENGRGVEKDLQQARLWYQRAAEAGNRMAMHNLAALYAGGDLGKQEFDAAAQWFEQAAERGMRDSQFNLGMLYARGLGVPQNLESSYKWFSLAAMHGDADGQKARDDIARSLDAETVGRLNSEIEAFEPTQIDLVANFAPIGTWSQSFDPGEAVTNAEVVKRVQAALGTLGFDVGTPDGLIGPKTADAIRTFERGIGMSETGAVNPRLLAVLGSQPV